LNPLRGKLHRDSPFVHCRDETDESRAEDHAGEKMLAHMNDPERINADHREFYYALLRLGNATEQPGAHVNGAWYLRNAKIFARLIQIARPASRLLIVFGSGHAYWLRHFVQNRPGFQLIEPGDYLQ
jgi:hypothetical protein